MALIKTSGLILKYVNLNDNDRLFTIFTKDMGKITAMSKGIRSHKHKDFASLGLYSFSELVLDDSRGLIYINSANLIENFYNLRTMLEKTSLVSYFADLVSFLADEISGDDEFFSFILNTIYLTAKVEPEKIDDAIS
ncbi:MAG: DNA repair protein RecO, partial [Clostridia bacterium]|nr:DNA repair protein RecO [Clostridia bacterium]